MAQTKKMEAKPVGRIVTRNGRELVGYLYEWNTGERQNAWLKRPRRDVVVEEFKSET